MNILQQLQQGDVWIEKVDSLAGHVVTDRTKRWNPQKTLTHDDAGRVASELRNSPMKTEVILAAGEVTGHHHRLKLADGFTLEALGEDKAVNGGIKVDMDKGIFELMEKAILTHEEHKPIELDPGLYRFGIIQEYDYESKQNRQVYD